MMHPFYKRLSETMRFSLSLMKELDLYGFNISPKTNAQKIIFSKDKHCFLATFNFDKFQVYKYLTISTDLPLTNKSKTVLKKIVLFNEKVSENFDDSFFSILQNSFQVPPVFLVDKKDMRSVKDKFSILLRKEVAKSLKSGNPLDTLKICCHNSILVIDFSQGKISISSTV